ncbi:MAG: hypothetical protein QOF51_2262 [Chloroflexota bacterium]|nr:hypothetical protein [Chloroflexota bacterium]
MSASPSPPALASVPSLIEQCSIEQCSRGSLADRPGALVLFQRLATRETTVELVPEENSRLVHEPA